MPRDRKDKTTWKKNGGGEQDDYVGPGIRWRRFELDDEENPVPDDDDEEGEGVEDDDEE